MIKFPYGMADFRQIVTQGYFYCDRTSAIPLLEQAQSQLFIRPRRFGKSLLLSMLENYYDIARKDAFDAMFGHLAISRHPTPQRNFYFILRLDFSCVDPTGAPDDVKRSLFNHINARIRNFILYYGDNGFDMSRININKGDALDTIDSLVGVTASVGNPIYLMIDEYDNFANTVMMLPTLDSRDRYTALVHDEGVLRTFFKMVKSSTGGVMFDRVFITGVSPVVLSDITSGYNIAEDIFFEPEFGDLCGFREEEVAKTLGDIATGCGLGEEKASEALEMMRTYYNGYNFVPRGHVVVYNPTLCLYFFKQFQKRCAYPNDMLDANLAVDDSKLEYTANLPGGRDMVFTLSEREASIAVLRVSSRFGLSEMLSDHSKDKTFIASFLYYFGVLTLVGETNMGELVLKVPNLVIQGLYVERVQRMMLPDPVTRDRGLDAAKRVYQYGDIEQVCAFVEDVYFSVFKNRDYAQANELTLKTCFLTLLYNDILYIMDSEPELTRRYADLTMIIRPDKRYLQIYDVLIEFKFLSLKQLGLSGEAIRSKSPEELYSQPMVKHAMEEGTAQIMDYGRRLAGRYRDLRLKKFVVTALGFERICFLNADVLEG
jgi:hypothetical protein